MLPTKKVTGNNIDVVIASDTDSLYIDLSGIVDKVGVQNTELIEELSKNISKCIETFKSRQKKELFKKKFKLISNI
jgi:hypothetical protein